MVKILCICGDFSEDYEVMVPYQALEIAGFEVQIDCPGKKKDDTIQTAVHDFFPYLQFYHENEGHKFKLNYSFDDVKPEDYAGIYIPGGRAPEYLRYNQKVLDIINYFLKANKPTCAVCHGVLLLAATGNIKGRKMTGFYTTQKDLEAAGAEYDGSNEAKVDGNLVTGQSYLSHVPMLKEFIKILKQ